MAKNQLAKFISSLRCKIQSLRETTETRRETTQSVAQPKHVQRNPKNTREPKEESLFTHSAITRKFLSKTITKIPSTEDQPLKITRTTRTGEGTGRFLLFGFARDRGPFLVPT
jgi:hypothetical protein